MDDLTCTGCGEYAGSPIADRIEELEALYEAAKHDAQEAEAYAEALEAKLYDNAMEELNAKGRGPWPNAIRAVNYRVGTNEDGGTVWAHRIEQYHEGRWTAIRVYNESEDGTLEEELSSNPWRFNPRINQERIDQ